jgi:glycosidase
MIAGRSAATADCPAVVGTYSKKEQTVHRFSIRLVVLVIVFGSAAFPQDSVDVTFRYTPPLPQTSVTLPGEFNGWNNQAWPMTPIGNNTFVRTVRLRIGGHIGGMIPGAYQYKFYYSGAAPWPNDPLNHRINRNDNDNSILYVRDPTIYHFVPNQRTGIVKTDRPVISAYLFPKVGSSVDTASIVLRVDTTTYRGLGLYYNPSTKVFSFQVPAPLRNGTHTLYLSAGQNADTVTITLQAGFVQITNLGGFTTRNPVRTLFGSVEDSSIRSARIVRNNTDTILTSVSNGRFAAQVSLQEGVNVFRAIVTDSTGTVRFSDPVSFTHLVDHKPIARIDFSESAGSIILRANASTDPDSTQRDSLRFLWSVDSRNPSAVTGVDGSTDSTITISKPSVAGEYYFRLIATDPNGNADTTRSFFTITDNGAFISSTMASVPQWVKNGRLYEMFFKSFTPQGTINAAIPYLPYLKSLGVNIVWVMPIMENAFPINNGPGPGYNIKNFYRVAPEYGTNQDFKNFVARAHELGLKIILDVTPNHTSFAHDFAQHARLYRENSPYWRFYEHAMITSNTNGMGDCLTNDGFNYYCNFSDQLLNYDWSDVDARHYMTEVYLWWTKEFDLDGFRYDVYWGPRRRYGEQVVGRHLRAVLKRWKPDIYLLAEDDATGPGTEEIYADRNGGADSGYDWNLYFGAVTSLYQRGWENFHATLFNNGFSPGPNASFMRFLENHDEERIVYVYGNYQKTIPPSTVLFTAPGMPLIYSGQEVGYGVGISNFDQRRRGVIDWNAGGKSLLMPHYQRLAHIRANYPAFSSQQLTRIPSGFVTVYSFVRPAARDAGVVAASIDLASRQVSLTLQASTLGMSIQDGVTMYANDLYNDTSYAIEFSGGVTTLNFTLPAYGSAVFVISDSMKRLNLPVLVSAAQNGQMTPSDFALYQNYPNPFNPTTTITYDLPFSTHVTFTIYNILGQQVALLENRERFAGRHILHWNGLTDDGSSAPSGIYFARMVVPGYSKSLKMLLLR